MSDYEIEPFPGLPEPLPEGETVLWQSAPKWGSLARHGFHLREAAIYFAVLLAWYVVSTVLSGETPGSVAVSTLKLSLLAAAALGLIALYAFIICWTTLYTVTSRRVVIRAGIALPTVVNIPFRSIAAAGFKSFGDRSGNIVLTLAPAERLAYLILWPNVRAWRVGRVEPMLRGIPEVAAAAQIVARALAASAAMAPVPLESWEAVGSDVSAHSETAAA